MSQLWLKVQSAHLLLFTRFLHLCRLGIGALGASREWPTAVNKCLSSSPTVFKVHTAHLHNKAINFYLKKQQSKHNDRCQYVNKTPDWGAACNESRT